MALTFERDNDKNKRRYYQTYIVVELLILISLYFFQAHWFLLAFFTPVILLDWWSNARCANRQKKFIKHIKIGQEGITSLLANNTTVHIPLERCLFSIREKKFEKERTEIEIREKRLLKSKLIGRMHIKNWGKIFEIRDAIRTHKIYQIQYRPEGYWAKYGTLTADVAITGAAIAHSHLSDQPLNSDLILPITSLEDDFELMREQQEKHNRTNRKK